MMLIIKTLLNDNDVEDGDTFSKVWEYWQPGTYSTADKYLGVLSNMFLVSFFEFPQKIGILEFS